MIVRLVYSINLRREGDNVPGRPFVPQELTGSCFLTTTNFCSQSFPNTPSLSHFIYQKRSSHIIVRMKRCVRAAKEVKDYGDMKGLADQDSEESDAVN